MEEKGILPQNRIILIVTEKPFEKTQNLLWVKPLNKLDKESMYPQHNKGHM